MTVERTSAVERLRTVLQINAGFSLGSGLLLAVGAQPLAPAIAPGLSAVAGIPLWGIVMVVGLGVVAFALEVLRVARYVAIPAGSAWRICIADGLWVAGSLALLLLAGTHLSGMGIALVAAAGAVVAVFTLLEQRALRGLAHREEAALPSATG